jgi:hypothetical protein
MTPSLTLRGLPLAAACATPPSGGDPGHKGFSLWSPGRVDNALLETRYGGKNPANANCPVENISPALGRARAPAATRSSKRSRAARRSAPPASCCASITELRVVATGLLAEEPATHLAGGERHGNGT